MSLEFTPFGLAIALTVAAIVGVTYVVFIRRELR